MARHMSDRFSRRNRGVTIIEVMVVVLILAVVAAVAAPNLNRLFVNNRLETANNEFMASLNLARSEALRRGLPVTMGRVPSDGDCVAPSKDWTCGWRIFVDLNEDGVCNSCDSTLDGEVTIRVVQSLSVTKPQSARTLSLYSSPAIQRTLRDGTVIANGLAEFIPFSADGRIPLVIDDGDDKLKLRATFVLCHWEVVNGVNQALLSQGGQTRSRAVLLNSAGRARPGLDSNKNGVPENAIGEDILLCSYPT